MDEPAHPISSKLEERFLQLLDATPDAMVIVDRGGRIVLVNAAAEALFGYVRDELLGASVELLIPERYRGVHPQHRTRYATAPRTRMMGHPGVVAETSGPSLYGLRKDGSEFPAEISLSPFESGDDALAITAIRDITERKLADQALLAAKAAAEAANRELEAFSYSVAHDLRAPLRSILGFSEILQNHHQGALDDKGREYLRRIGAAVTRMGQLIDALLSLSRVTRAELRMERVDLSQMARVIAGHLAEGQPERAVTWVIPGDITALGDARLLQALLENLLGNAWKFTSRRGAARVELGARRSTGEVVYFVRDNGAGFDMANADRLFTPFVRLHSSAQFSGSGIGLATVARIVLRHGGRIWAESAPGEGATFFFTLTAFPDGTDR